MTPLDPALAVCAVHEARPPFGEDKTLAITDSMSPALRACVHEFGFTIVHAFVECGMRDPGKIRHLVHTCWAGPRSMREKPKTRKDGTKRAFMETLDWLLMNSGSTLSAEGLVRELKGSNLVILPFHATPQMVDASIAATGEMGLVSKREKHQGRLNAAIRAAAVRMWPTFFGEAKP